MFPSVAIQPDIDDRQVQLHEAHAEVVMPGRDMRALGLQTASDRLRMNVADLGVVQEARARADITLCPICPVPHRT